MYIGILVVLVCVVLYVFYVSKDIVTLDNEVRTLKSQLGQVVQTISSRQSSHPQAPTPSKTQVATQVDISATRDEDVDEIESVKTEHMASLLVNLQEEEELEEEEQHVETDEVVVEDTAEVMEEVLPMQEKTVYSFQDLKDLCKKHGLHSKGTKQQLVELLKAHEIIQ